MELKTYKKPNPLKVFDNISKMKKILKPIRVKNNNEFIEKLLQKPNELCHLISEGYSIEDGNHVEINCELKCNITIEFRARFGDGLMYWITREKPNGVNLDSPFERDDKNGLIEILESLTLPDKIIFTEIELTQVIGNSKSVFKYNLIE